MRVKLDENLPKLLAEFLAGAGHDVETVLSERLGGAPDPDVLVAAAAEDRILFTLDRGVGALVLTGDAHPGLIILRLQDQVAPLVVASVEELLAAYPLEELAGATVIVQPGRVRIRRRSGEPGP